MSTTMSRGNTLLGQVHLYCELFPEERQKCDKLAEWITEERDPLSGHALPAHITASGIVLSADRVLLIYHPTLARWLQPGGHVELGEQPLQAALREVEEETAMSCVPHGWHGTHPIPFDIDVHSIPANPHKGEVAHYHCDFRYLLNVNCSVVRMKSLHQYCWFDANDVGEAQLDAVRDVLQKVSRIAEVRL